MKSEESSQRTNKLSKIKFKEDPNLIQLAEEVYLYRSFYDNTIIQDLTDRLNSFQESDWHQHGNFEIGDHEDTFWGDKCSLDILNYEFHDKIFNFFSPNYWMYQHTNFVRLKQGQHSDLTKTDESLTKLADYKVALYLGSFDGGAICFPELFFKYKPEPNDLLIFKSSYNHHTEEVTSGTRYAYMDYLIYHPGYYMP